MSGGMMVFGRAGQLGTELVRVLSERGHTVIPIGRAEVDVTDTVRVSEIISTHTPDFVFNAAAYNMVDAAERDPGAAFAGNALAVRNFAVACRQTGSRLVTFSTDYVFDGTLGRPYYENDPPHPIGAYGVSKLAGEMYAQAYLENALIIRTSGVFGLAGVGTARGNFVETMLRIGAKADPVRVVECYTASPTYAPLLAERTADLIERNASGVFHIGGGEPVAWLDFARMIFAVAGLSPDLRAVDVSEHSTPARRPLFSALANARMADLGVQPMPSVEECLKAYMRGRPSALQSDPPVAK